MLLEILTYAIPALIFLLACFAFFPWYGVWAAKKSGEADLAHAQNEQLVQVAQAEGRLKAAQMNKDAAIIEAQAVRAQIDTIGEGLKQHDLYLKWQWIKMMEERPKGTTIYVPTEANIPILEVNRK